MKKKKAGRKPYYGKKGGSAVYKNEMNFNLVSTLSALKDYYEGRSAESKKK